MISDNSSPIHQFKLTCQSHPTRTNTTGKADPKVHTYCLWAAAYNNQCVYLVRGRFPMSSVSKCALAPEEKNHTLLLDCWSLNTLNEWILSNPEAVQFRHSVLITGEKVAMNAADSPNVTLHPLNELPIKSGGLCSPVRFCCRNCITGLLSTHLITMNNSGRIRLQLAKRQIQKINK